ncbi:DNA repair protein RecN, partial [Oscillospiraceae bacterium OttesenSCG-928-F05]|nr:DNA repair protein RecN [Oscillospiraceae bacterium OttesenSCG-928-F05]
VDGLIAHKETLQNALDDIVFSEEALEKAEKERDKALALTLKEAGRLSELRKKAAAVLSNRVMEELRGLEMQKVRFKVEFDETEGKRLTATGADRPAFYLAANLGEALKPLSKTASGGELARIMLAMKVVLSESDTVGTVIFDEVDAGVSGRAAQAVAEKMAKVAAGRQVLCVSHLPQIAAMADTHFRIEKREHGGRTVTHVAALDADGRAEEIARIIGGAAVTETTFKHASEMILSADRYKKEQRK